MFSGYNVPLHVGPIHEHIVSLLT